MIRLICYLFTIFKVPNLNNAYSDQPPPQIVGPKNKSPPPVSLPLSLSTKKKQNKITNIANEKWYYMYMKWNGKYLTME